MDAEKTPERQPIILSSRTHAAVALVVTACFLALKFRPGYVPAPPEFALLDFGLLLRGWALVAINAAFWGIQYWILFWILRGTQGRERLFVSGWAVLMLVSPVVWMFPQTWAVLQYVKVAGLVTALIAATSVVVRPLRDEQPFHEVK